MKRSIGFLLLAVFLVGCPGRRGKVDIGGIVVDATNLDQDKAEYQAASKRWHAGERSFSDAASKADADIIIKFARKNYRSALSLAGSIYATESIKSPYRETDMWYTAARFWWKDAAMLGDDNAIQILAVNYRTQGVRDPVEAGVWGLVALGVCKKDHVFATNAELASASMAPLNEMDREIARRRADVLIKQIRENREAYDQVVGKDI